LAKFAFDARISSQLELDPQEGDAKKNVRKSDVRKAAAARPAARRHAKIQGLRRGRAQDRVAAKSGVSSGSPVREAPAASGEAAREFPNAVYQDGRRS
jgi:hypothetical protein